MPIHLGAEIFLHRVSGGTAGGLLSAKGDQIADEEGPGGEEAEARDHFGDDGDGDFPAAAPDEEEGDDHRSVAEDPHRRDEPLEAVGEEGAAEADEATDGTHWAGRRQGRGRRRGAGVVGVAEDDGAFHRRSWKPGIAKSASMGCSPGKTTWMALSF